MLTIDESVLKYLSGIRNKANPALYIDDETKLLTVESQLSEHEGQTLLLRLGDTWLDDPELLASDLLSLLEDSIVDQ